MADAGEAPGCFSLARGPARLHCALGGFAMITRICKVLFGALACGTAAVAIWQIVSQNVLPDIWRWTVSGGVQHISGYGCEGDVSARVLASVIVLVPIAFAACGCWLLLSAFSRDDKEVA